MCEERPLRGAALQGRQARLSLARAQLSFLSLARSLHAFSLQAFAPGKAKVRRQAHCTALRRALTVGVRRLLAAASSLATRRVHLCHQPILSHIEWRVSARSDTPLTVSRREHERAQSLCHDLPHAV